MKLNINIGGLSLEQYLSCMPDESIECFCGISGTQSETHGPVYRFATEDISTYLPFFNVTQSLTVNGSSDQLINALLYGAQQVDTFDINYDTLHILLIKLYALPVLNCEEFLKLLNKVDINLLESRVLPNAISGYQKFWEEILRKYGKKAFYKLLNGPLLEQTPKNKICKILSLVLRMRLLL